MSKLGEMGQRPNHRLARGIRPLGGLEEISLARGPGRLPRPGRSFSAPSNGLQPAPPMSTPFPYRRESVITS